MGVWECENLFFIYTLLEALGFSGPFLISGTIFSRHQGYNMNDIGSCSVRISFVYRSYIVRISLGYGRTVYERYTNYEQTTNELIRKHINLKL